MLREMEADANSVMTILCQYHQASEAEYIIIRYSIVWNSLEHCSLVIYIIVQYSIVQHSTVKYIIVLHSTV